MRQPLAKWLPDLPGLAGPGSNNDAQNVIPDNNGYRPFLALSNISTTALSEQALGAFTAQDFAGVATTFAGSASKLYLLSSGVFSDVSKMGGYSASATEPWEFAQFGEVVLATEISDALQQYTLNSSSVFANVAGSPPQARHIGVVRDFVVLGNTATSNRQVVWGGFNTTTQWTAGQNQSDAQTLPDGGGIQRIIGGEYGLIFQDRAIVRMTYVGPPLIFRFDTIEQRRGLGAAHAIAKFGNNVFFWDATGFFVTDGSASQSIGNLKCDHWFRDNLNPNTLSSISTATDPLNNVIMVNFVSGNAANPAIPDTQLIYNYLTGDFSYAKNNVEYLFHALSSGVTLEQLGSIYPVIENVPASFDSPIWAGGNQFLGAFGTDHNLGSFTGATLAATMTLSDFEGVDGRRSMITNARPDTDTSSATVTILSRERAADATVSTAMASMQSNGDCPVMSSGRVHQATLNIPAGSSWTYANYLDIDAVDDGEI